MIKKDVTFVECFGTLIVCALEEGTISISLFITLLYCSKAEKLRNKFASVIASTLQIFGSLNSYLIIGNLFTFMGFVYLRSTLSDYLFTTLSSNNFFLLFFSDF